MESQRNGHRCCRNLSNLIMHSLSPHHLLCFWTQKVRCQGERRTRKCQKTVLWAVTNHLPLWGPPAGSIPPSSEHPRWQLPSQPSPTATFGTLGVSPSLALTPGPQPALARPTAAPSSCIQRLLSLTLWLCWDKSVSALHPVSEGLSPSPAASLSLFLSQNHLSLEPGPCLNPPKLFVLHSAPSCFNPALPQDGASPRSGANSLPLPLHWLHPHRHPLAALCQFALPHYPLEILLDCPGRAAAQPASAQPVLSLGQPDWKISSWKAETDESPSPGGWMRDLTPFALPRGLKLLKFPPSNPTVCKVQFSIKTINNPMAKKKKS